MPASFIFSDFTWTTNSAQYVLTVWMLSLSLLEIEKTRDMLNDTWKEQIDSPIYDHHDV